MTARSRTPADYYVSFDNKGIGRAIAQSLVDHLKASGVPEGRRACSRSTARPPTRQPA
jgi:ABC-type xylose transport system substrate-binding protein